MARNNITDYSTTPSSNTDIGGVGIGEPDSAKGLRDAEQQMAAALARMNAGTAPLDDTFRVRNTDDTSITAGLSTEDTPTGTDRALNVEKLFRYGAARMTVYASTGTHTFLTKTKYFEIEASGGGGGGGSVDGRDSSSGGASGGWSGFWGKTGILSKGAATTGSFTIGTGGAGGTGGSDGTAGGSTIWTDTTNGTLTWPGGPGGIGVISDTFGVVSLAADGPTVSSSIRGGVSLPTPGSIQNILSPPGMRGGDGGSSELGVGGKGSQSGGTGAVAGGSATIGFGGGGGGGATRNTTSNAAGGAGRPGFLIVREW